jgi:predicted MFS family arabinose efflux permease
VLTAIGVTGHFIAYTFIVVIIRDVVGVRGPNLALLLAAFGIAGLISMGVMVRPMDRRPQASAVGCLTALAIAFAVLSALAFRDNPGVLTALIGIAAIVLWGAASPRCRRCCRRCRCALRPRPRRRLRAETPTAPPGCM